MRRTINLRALAILAAVVAVTAVSVHFVHGFQVNRHADTLLELATQAEADAATLVEHAGIVLDATKLGPSAGLRRLSPPPWAAEWAV